MPTTYLAYHYDGKLHTYETTTTSITPFSALPEPTRALFKEGTDEHYVVTTAGTIFHPQGGGQPSDTGTMELLPSRPSTPPTKFTVHTARKSNNQVLHLGTFDSSSQLFTPGEIILQKIDPAKRLLHSRLHTAGHVLGGAVRQLLEDKIEGFDELKASHFPGSAACEFRGLIPGEWKGGIQERVREIVEGKVVVRVEWWRVGDFEERGLGRLLGGIAGDGDGDGDENGGEEEEGKEKKLRVVVIDGVETYPCGGTHVDTTDLCGEVLVKKIVRKSGVSKWLWYAGEQTRL
ncbi:alanyl-tRNA synthetase [Aspergillus campestris IBT 28561]|uniref:Alanyl-tRNA synthetase n=1 Tax=Aspergillus campestris (strain IBT 28561) TaxID=1392248 RepID=A0A2I1CZN7_ASPC2|nr:alanyl-tRNA synthetase [Aspergillus campestris IBT 28561]PKY03090.1 alanyl-tRNA synthetase [Aspergillus campestris IBT 28561]